MKLVDFLRARLDEDEAAAKAATPGPWWYNPGKQWLDPEAFEKYDLAKGEEFVGYGGPHPFTGAVCATGPASHSQSMADAAHIARSANPARVLAEVEAKRRILDDVLPTMQADEISIAGEWGVGSDPVREASDDLLSLLALPYRDHPDFDPAWLEN